MLNDKFEVIHLKQRKITTPLFPNAMEAYSIFSEPRKHPATYLVIDSTTPIDQRIFRQTNICPVYIYNNKSYIFLEGECLWRYFLARKDSDHVLPEQQLWTMITQLTSALTVLRQNGHEYHHLRQYAVRRITPDHFKLIYHPEMKTVTQIVEQTNDRWPDFYLPPEQLPPQLNNEQSNSCVFSLGAMTLNLMNPLDFKRDIYSRKSYALNTEVIDSKMKNILSLYSPSIAEIIRNMLMPDPAKRIKLDQLQKLIQMLNPRQKKLQIIHSIKPYVTNKLGNSQSKKKQSQPKQDNHSIEKYNKTISFIRGTFGNQNSAQSSLQFERGTFGGHPHPEMQNSNATLRGSISSGESNSQYINQQIEFPLTTAISYKQYLQQANKQKKQQDAAIKLSLSEQTTPFRNLYISSASKHHIQTSTKQKEYSVEDSSLHLSNFSILKPSPESDPIQQELTGFKTKIQEYQLQLNDCLQPLGDLIERMKIPGLRINQDTYYGQLKAGRRNGLGLEIFPNRQYYYGFFKEDLFHGEGFYFWNRTKYFLGIFEQGSKVEGSWWGAGIKYVGQITANRRHGIGSCYYSNGRIYEGQWLEGKRHGSGILSEPSGQQFIGCFKAGLKYGKGSFLTESCRIIGIWNEDEPMGQVQIIYDNGNRYKGTINQKYEKQGSGEFRFCGGCVCKGKFWEDEFTNGEIQYRNGERYVGDTKAFQRHGTGVYYYNNGKIVYGQWRQGIIIRQLHT